MLAELIEMVQYKTGLVHAVLSDGPLKQVHVTNSSQSVDISSMSAQICDINL